MKNNNAVVAIYKSHIQAEAAVKELLQSKFDMKKLSIVGRDYLTDEEVVGYYHAGGHMRHWGKLGSFWGGIWGLLFGSGFFFIPALGPLLAAGPLVGGIVGALEEGVGGRNALGAGLSRVGIPGRRVPQYEKILKSGKFLVIANGSEEETNRARQIINLGETEVLEVHQPSDPVPEPHLA
jgi:hypothetical protein